MRARVAMLLVPAIALTAVNVVRAGTVCVSNGIHVNHVGEGSVCTAAPADARVATSQAHATVTANAGGIAVGKTGYALDFSVSPPKVRVWVNGTEFAAGGPQPSPTPTPTGSPTPSPSPSASPSPAPPPTPPPPPAEQVCATNLVAGPGGAGGGTACVPVEGIPGEVRAVNKSLFFGAYYRDLGGDGEPLGDTSVEVSYARTPVAVRVIVDGALVYRSPNF